MKYARIIIISPFSNDSMVFLYLKVGFSGIFQFEIPWPLLYHHPEVFSVTWGMG